MPFIYLTIRYREPKPFCTMSTAWRITILLLVLTLATDSFAQRKRQARETRTPERIVLASEGFTRYRIGLPSAPSEYETQAAEVMRRYLPQTSGAAFPV